MEVSAVLLEVECSVLLLLAVTKVGDYYLLIL